MASQWWMLPRSYSGGCRCSGVDNSPAWQPQGLWNIVHAGKIRRFEIGIFGCFRLHVKQNMLTALRRMAAPTPSLMSRTLSRHSVRAIFNPRARRTVRAIGLPTSLLIDREGREFGRAVGPAQWDSAATIAFFRHAVLHESQTDG